MDILAHGLWANVMYKNIPQTRNDKRATWLGILFGLLPDLISFTPVFVYLIYSAIFKGVSVLRGPEAFPQNRFFHFASVSYNYTHSLVVFFAGILLLWLFLKKFPYFALGWGLHIFIDIFTHTEKFYATPFLYPISNYKFSGISWANPIFMAVNYSALLIFYLVLLPRLKKP